MGPYNPVEPIARLIKQSENGRELPQTGGQTLSELVMVFKGIIILARTAMFKDYIRDWRRQTTDQKTWTNHKTFLY